jgi:uncharacterized glyoxalase superfamily protein PhnB
LQPSFLGEFRNFQGRRRLATPNHIETARHRPDAAVTGASAADRSAIAASAEIVIEIKDEDYGGRGFSCRDPEGHIWNVGTYNPWEK